MDDAQVWDQILKKCSVEGYCLVWTGSMRSSKNQTFPDFKYKGSRCSVYKLAYQHHNNIEVDKTAKYEFLCDNRRCVSKDHLMVVYPVTEFNSEYAWKIIRGNVEISEGECWLWKGYISPRR